MADESTVPVVHVRYLACLDTQQPVGATCQNMAWIEQPTWASYLPTVEQGVGIGGILMTSLLTIAAAKRLLKPPKDI